MVPIIAAPLDGAACSRYAWPMDPMDHDLNKRYFAAIRGRDVEALLALFADDAVMILPDGKELAGKDALRTMYDYVFGTDPPPPYATASVAGPDSVATEIEAILADGTPRRTANFFYLDEHGLIKRLSVYRRG